MKSMKNKIFTLTVSILLWVGCDRREIPTYDTKIHYIEFENATTDSTIFTFIYYPNDDYYDLPVGVKLAGDVADRDMTYNIVVDEELSTVESKHYALPQSMVFRQGMFHDTCYVRLNKTEDLDSKSVRLVLRLVGTSDMPVGKLENSVAVVLFSNTVEQPVWWNSDVETYYLGTYSQKKFLLFLEVTGADLTDATVSEIRAAALEFERYLIDHKGEPETVEDDGQPMTVPVLGLEEEF